MHTTREVKTTPHKDCAQYVSRIFRQTIQGLRISGLLQSVTVDSQSACVQRHKPLFARCCIKIYLVLFGVKLSFFV